MASYDFNRPFIPISELTRYVAIDQEVARRYGKYVKATPFANSEYTTRYIKSEDQKRMKPPPSARRIFPGYLVVRNVGKANEYETWIPESAFMEIYEEVKTG